MEKAVGLGARVLTTLGWVLFSRLGSFTASIDSESRSATMSSGVKASRIITRRGRACILSAYTLNNFRNCRFPEREGERTTGRELVV